MANNALIYRFQADTSGLRAGVADVRNQLNSLTAATKTSASSVSSGFDTLKSGLASVKTTAEIATLGLSALAVGVATYLLTVGQQASAFGDKIRSAAGAFDQTVQTAGEINSVAERSGSSLEAVGAAFVNLQKKAKDGDVAVVTALRAVGVSVSEVANLSQRELTLKMADTFSSLRDSSNKAAAGVALFGADVAGKLVPQLDRGRASVLGMMDAAHRAGAVIGPELSEKLAGTSGLFAQFKDRLSELGMTITGRLLQSYAAFKAAIDGLILSFTDLVGNLTTVVEWIYNLNGAGEKGGQAFGMMTDAANWFAKSLIKIISGAQEMALAIFKYVDETGMSFHGLVAVVEAVGQDIANIGRVYARSFYDEWSVNLSGLAHQFVNLGVVAARALKFDFSGAKAAYGDYTENAKKLAEEYQKAVNPDYLKNTHAAWDAMQLDANKYTKEIKASSVELERQKKSQLDMIAAGGISARPVGMQSAGDPTVRKAPAAAKDATEAKDAIERYIDTLSKAEKIAKAEADTWASSNVQREKAKGLAELTAAAEKDGLTVTEEQRQKVISLTTLTQTLKDKTEEMKSMAQGLSETFAGALDQIIVKGGNLNDVLKQVLQSLASAVLRGSLMGDGMFGSLGGAAGGGGLFGSLFKGLFSGFRADGGSVMGGRAYVVGERGPELFQPNGGGMIIPNGGNASSSGSSPTINIHLAGANGDATIQRMVMQGVQAGLGHFSNQVLPGRVNDIAMRGA